MTPRDPAPAEMRHHAPTWTHTGDNVRSAPDLSRASLGDGHTSAQVWGCDKRIAPAGVRITGQGRGWARVRAGVSARRLERPLTSAKTALRQTAKKLPQNYASAGIRAIITQACAPPKPLAHPPPRPPRGAREPAGAPMPLLGHVQDSPGHVRASLGLIAHVSPGTRPPRSLPRRFWRTNSVPAKRQCDCRIQTRRRAHGEHQPSSVSLSGKQA